MSLGSCDAVRHGRLFCGMLCRSCRYGSTACLPLCKASLSHTHTQRPAEEGLQSPPSESHKEETLLGWWLALFTSGSFHVLVGCPWNGHRPCHCARNIVLSFMLLLLLLNYNMWLLFYYYFFCLNALKRSFKSVDLLMYSAFAAMDQNQELCR